MRCWLVAADYKNEAEVGDALKEAFDSGLVKREDLFITTKVSFTIVPVDLILFLCDVCDCHWFCAYILFGLLR